MINVKDYFQTVHFVTNIVVQCVEAQFADVFQMNLQEKERLIYVLHSVYSGNFDKLPNYIIDSLYDGFYIVVEKLIKTGFTVI